MPVVPIIAALVILVELHRAPSRYLIPFILVAGLGDELVTIVIKDLENRARPTLNAAAAGLGSSFPSGH